MYDEFDDEDDERVPLAWRIAAGLYLICLFAAIYAGLLWLVAILSFVFLQSITRGGGKIQTRERKSHD